MHRVTVDKIIEVPVDEAWRIVDDFGGVYRYHPRVDRSPLIGDRAAGLGARRTCHFDDGSSIVEEVTDYAEGESYEVTITDPGAFPLHEAVGRISVRSAPGGNSRVVFEMAFRPKFGPVGWLMGKAVMEGQFRKILGSVVDGIETHARTGQVVSRKRRAAAA